MLRDELYNRIMEVFLDRIERSKAGIGRHMSSTESPLHLFEAFGVEIEYMIVDARTLDVRPITDRVLQAVAGEIVSDVEMGEITWSNELTAHVIELKTTDPARSLGSAARAVSRERPPHQFHPRTAGGAACCPRPCTPGWTRTARW